MKLRKSKNQGELDCIIKTEGFSDFINRYCLDILNDLGEKIGEVKGYKLNLETIKEDINFAGGSSWFLAMDGLSQLCCWACEYLMQYKNLLMETDKFYFLNRLSFEPPFETLDNHRLALNLLMKKMGSVLYSFGSTELEDDFPEEPYPTYHKELEEMLLFTDWEFNEEFSFYFKRTVTDYPNEPLEKGLLLNKQERKLLFVNLGVSEQQIKKELGGDFKINKRRINRFSNEEYTIYTSDKTSKSIIFKIDNKEEIIGMNIHEAYLFKQDYGIEETLVDLTDSREEYIEIGNVEWETTVYRREYDTDLFCLKTIFAFKDDEDDSIIGKADVTILDQDTEPYSLLKEADYISSDLVYCFNGIPVYEDEWELEEKLRRRKRIGVYGKVAIVENFFIQGAISNIEETEKIALECMINYFSDVQRVDFIIINPILCDFHEHSLYKAPTEHKKRLIGAPKIRTFLKEEVNFIGSDEPTDSLLYPLVDIFNECEPLSESEKSDHIEKMFEYLNDGELEMCLEVALEGHEYGILECTFQLGTFHYYGEAVEEDKKAAFEYFFEVAQEGYPDAMYNVGIMYFDGIGVTKDVLQGNMWVEKAASKNHNKALDLIERMKRAQLQVAKNMALYFK